MYIYAYTGAPQTKHHAPGGTQEVVASQLSNQLQWAGVYLALYFEHIPPPL